MPAPEVRRVLVSLLPRLRRFALVLTRSADLADELVQSALVRALARFEQNLDQTHLDRWMFCVLKTVWLNMQRSAASRRAEPLDENCSVLASDGIRDAEARIALSQVLAAFDRLSDEQRQVMLLVCVEGYSYSAAAEFLSVPIGTVMSRLSRGRAALMAMCDASRPEKVSPFPARSIGKDASTSR
jgi:RNA polymerase sigma-70 factor, ECF subfamily